MLNSNNSPKIFFPLKSACVKRHKGRTQGDDLSKLSSLSQLNQTNQPNFPMVRDIYK